VWRADRARRLESAARRRASAARPRSLTGRRAPRVTFA
jgi:hypothetical protein